MTQCSDPSDEVESDAKDNIGSKTYEKWIRESTLLGIDSAPSMWTESRMATQWHFILKVYIVYINKIKESSAYQASWFKQFWIDQLLQGCHEHRNIKW